MAKIFIVEDNENIREAAAGYLRLEGFDVEEYGELKPARKAVEAASDIAAPDIPDLLILDVMLPDGDGFLFAKQLKIGSMGDAAADVPVIFLTARDQESDRITGLELGADDYIVKPFSMRELVLRVKAVLRRSSSGAEQEASEALIYRIGDDELKISETNHSMHFNSLPLQLTAAEWNIVIFLAEKSPQVFNRGQLLEYCLDSIAEGSERTIDTHIKNIRHKFGGSEWIETVRGFGYRFNGVKV